MTDSELILEIWRKVEVMNRELGGVETSLNILWKLMILILGASLIQIAASVYKNRKGSK